ncbi:hypothetical protein [Endozoicomonas sp. GU-1]|uniref:hypothetical protein n=1 Tax=Endozoicomonas sp. GU-1 TaxID=3009078 RepID=UPI0022B4B3C9|nr:hypothetical protein [Endozoicomonas sp. GU-1]WBA80873.1 hypothetical protein O2T12_21605 [Endozoicomonas sp. GU-1]WBA88436.1 hypothetical protein O3276_10790 [Endozoicomonas sp. GU-1]
MHSVNNGDASKITYNPHQESKNQKIDNTDNQVSQKESETNNPITHRTCNTAGDIAASSSVQAARALPDLPSIYMTKKFYRPIDKQTLFIGYEQLITHRDFRELLSKHMNVYAVLTSDCHGQGAANIMAFGKPKFKVNELKKNFFTTAFQSIPTLKETPCSSDMIGFLLCTPPWIVDHFYGNLEKKSANSGKMNSIEQSIFRKLKPKYEAAGMDTHCTVHHKDYLKDISPQEARFIFEQIFDESFEELKTMKEDSDPVVNNLNPKATIDDLPEIIRIYEDKNSLKRYNPWCLNYLDKALLNNVKWIPESCKIL